MDNSTKGNNMRASVKLFDKFQTQWQQIHSNSVNNLQKAKIVIEKLDRLEQNCSERSNALNSFIHGYKSIGELNNQIDNINCDIENLERCFTQLEDNLIILKAYKEWRASEDFINRVEAEFEAKVRDQKALSEIRKDKLMSEHLERVQAFEKDQLKVLEEKRLILEKEFQEDKNRYLANKPQGQ